MAEDQLFYVGQKAFIEKDGKLLILMDERGVDLPGGKIQEGNFHFENELKREVREETSLEIVVGTPFTVWHVQANLVGMPIKKPIFLIGYHCTYISGDVTLSHEHSDFLWATKDTYQTTFSPIDIPDYRKVIEKYFETISK